MLIRSWDIDGVLYIPHFSGLRPDRDDVIITGRSFEEAPDTLYTLRNEGITNQVLFNPLPKAEKTRVTSGLHKGKMLRALEDFGWIVDCHFEDDPVQIDAIKTLWSGRVIRIDSGMKLSDK